MALLAETKRILDYLRDARIGPIRTPEQHGAVGNGTTDDTTALKAMIAAANPGDRLILTGDYVHTQVINFNKPRLTIDGGGILRGTVPATSSVWLTADKITLRDITIRKDNVTTRLDAYEHMGLRIGGTGSTETTGVTVERVTVENAAAAGIYVGTTNRYTLDRCTIINSWADGIHQTDSCHHGKVIRPTVTRPGDDGVSVVSYRSQTTPCHHIDIVEPMVTNQTHGRGVSVVGGEDITYTNIRVHGSNSAAVYICGESGSFETHACRRIKIRGGVLSDCNRGVLDSTGPDHGAVLVNNYQPAETADSVLIEGLEIRDSHLGWRTIGVYNTPNSTVRDIRIVGKRGRIIVDSDAGSTNFTQSNVVVYPGTAVQAPSETWYNDPDAVVAAPPGTIMPMISNKTAWFKTSGTDMSGWVNLVGPRSITLSTNYAAATWASMPTAETELKGNTGSRIKADLTRYRTARITVAVGATAGFAGSKIVVQYSTDQSTWKQLDDGTGTQVTIDSTGGKASGSVNLAATARADVWLRVVGIGGNGTVSPIIGTITLEVA